MVDWSYYDKFEDFNEKYLPPRGEGETKATQIVTAVAKLVYKWYNDGDVFDNTAHLDGWANDLSDYANWLYTYTTDHVKTILDTIYGCWNDDEYEALLQELADELLNEEYLIEQNKIDKVGTIYHCAGKFEFLEDKYGNDDYYEDEDEDW